MAGELVPVLLASGVIGYVLVENKPAPLPGATTKAGANVTTGGTSQPIGQLVAQGGVTPVGKHLPAALKGLVRPPVGGAQPLPSALGDPTKPPWSVTIQKLNEIEAAAKSAYAKLDDKAKQNAAGFLNDELNLKPPLTGTESWEDLAQKAGSEIGGEVGGWIGGPYGAKLGAIIGAYFGVKLEELLSKDLNDLGNWLSNQWGAVEDAVSDAANAVGDAVSDAASSVGDAASDAYNDASSYLGSLF